MIWLAFLTIHKIVYVGFTRNMAARSQGSSNRDGCSPLTFARLRDRRQSRQTNVGIGITETISIGQTDEPANASNYVCAARPGRAARCYKSIGSARMSARLNHRLDTQSAIRNELLTKTSAISLAPATVQAWPLGRSSRRASGTPRRGSAQRQAGSPPPYLLRLAGQGVNFPRPRENRLTCAVLLRDKALLRDFAPLPPRRGFRPVRDAVNQIVGIPLS